MTKDGKHLDPILEVRDRVYTLGQKHRDRARRLAFIAEAPFIAANTAVLWFLALLGLASRVGAASGRALQATVLTLLAVLAASAATTAALGALHLAAHVQLARIARRAKHRRVALEGLPISAVARSYSTARPFGLPTLTLLPDARWYEEQAAWNVATQIRESVSSMGLKDEVVRELLRIGRAGRQDASHLLGLLYQLSPAATKQAVRLLSLLHSRNYPPYRQSGKDTVSEVLRRYGQDMSEREMETIERLLPTWDGDLLELLDVAQEL